MFSLCNLGHKKGLKNENAAISAEHSWECSCCDELSLSCCNFSRTFLRTFLMCKLGHNKKGLKNKNENEIKNKKNEFEVN